jgi:hypothetical protein
MKPEFAHASRDQLSFVFPVTQTRNVRAVEINILHGRSLRALLRQLNPSKEKRVTTSDQRRSVYKSS